MTNERNTTGWVKLFHPDVPSQACSLPLPALFADGSAVDAGAAFEAVRSYLRAGFLTGDPALQPGQVRERISHVVRRAKLNDDDSETPLIDLYADSAKLVHKRFSRYLNTPDEVREFEAQAGVKLGDLPLYASRVAASREDREFAKFARALPAPVEIVLAPNPHYEEGAMKPKHVWVGFAGGAPANGNGNGNHFAGLPEIEPPPAPPEFSQQKAVIAWVQGWNTNSVSSDDLLAALGVTRFRDYAGTFASADQTVREFLTAKGRIAS